MALISPAIDIFAISVVLVVASKFLQKKLIDKEKQKAAQQRMKEKQKRIKELVQKGDDRSKQEVKRLQQEIFQEMGESMQGSMRYMMVSLPLFFGVFFVLGNLYGGTSFEALFPLPKFNNFFLLNPGSWIPVGISTTTGWLKQYFFTYLIVSIVWTVAAKVIAKTRSAEKPGSA